MFTQLDAKPVKKAKYIKHNSPKERSCGKNKIRCQITGRRGGIIRKYGLNICRQSFREVATKLGFKKYS
ncbi:MAG: 30S ribosomal protein S14 [archaeon]|nr:30S ribosomal protein S14 [archaeon]